jgi:hypothetical protein
MILRVTCLGGLGGQELQKRLPRQQVGRKGSERIGRINSVSHPSEELPLLLLLRAEEGALLGWLNGEAVLVRPGVGHEEDPEVRKGDRGGGSSESESRNYARGRTEAGNGRVGPMRTLHSAG